MININKKKKIKEKKRIEKAFIFLYLKENKLSITNYRLRKIKFYNILYLFKVVVVVTFTLLNKYY